MKGLVLKDFINLKKNLKIFAGLTVLYAAMALFTEDASFFSTIFMMLVAILTISLYSYDDLAKWDTYVLTMPVSRDEVVCGKYLMMLLLTLIGVLYSSVFTGIINIAMARGDFFLGFQSIGAAAAIVILFYSITIPFIVKLGVEKARMIFFAVYIIPFVTILAFSKMMENGSMTIPKGLLDLFTIVMNNIYIILPILDLVALGISYLISIRIYRKKEF